MSEVPTAEEKAAAARRGPGSGPRRGPMNVGTPGEKSRNFWPSAKRLVGRLRPERTRVLTAIALTLVSVALSALGPLVLARATDRIFAGWIGAQLPAGVPVATVSIGGARNAGLLAARILASGTDDRARQLRRDLNSFAADLNASAQDKGRALRRRLSQ